MIKSTYPFELISLRSKLIYDFQLVSYTLSKFLIVALEWGNSLFMAGIKRGRGQLDVFMSKQWISLHSVVVLSQAWLLLIVLGFPGRFFGRSIDQHMTSA